MKHLKTFLLATIAILSLTMTSCNDNDGPSYLYFGTIATFDGNRDNRSYYTIYNSETGAAITVYADMTIPETAGVKPGDRLFIQFRTNDDFDLKQGGLIAITSITKCLGGNFRIVPSDSIQYFNNEIYLTSLTRNGKYIDMVAMMPQEEGVQYELVTTQEDLATSIPKFYLSVTHKENATQGARLNYIASFNIDQVWRNPSVTGIDVKVNNAANPNKDLFSFNK